MEHQRALVQAGHGQVLNDALRLDITEGADLAADIAAHAAVSTQDDDIGVHAHALQLLDGMLGRLGLVLVGAGNIGHQHNMDVAAVVAALLQAHLTDGLQERLALNIAGGAADLGNDHIGIGRGCHVVDVILDLVGDVGDDLDGLTQISALALLVQYVPVHLAGGQVGVLVQIFVDEALVVAQIKVGLGAVIGHEYLTVLQGAHGAGVHVHIRVQLLAGDLQSAALEQAAQRSRRDALAQTGDNAAGHKDEFCHLFSPPLIYLSEIILSQCGCACIRNKTYNTKL